MFSDPDGAHVALGHAGKGQIIEFPIPEPGGTVGLKAWVQQHKAQRPGNSELQKQLDNWMAEHEAAEERKRREREASMAEDGWTVVVRSKVSGALARSLFPLYASSGCRYIEQYCRLGSQIQHRHRRCLLQPLIKVVCFSP